MFYLLILGSKFSPTAKNAKVTGLANAEALKQALRIDSLYCADT